MFFLDRFFSALFGAGLGVLTVLIQMYMNFLGGSILALVIMNLASPLLDKTGLQNPTETKEKIVLPKSKQFTGVNTVSCMRCGACMRVCCHRLSQFYSKRPLTKATKKS